MTLARVRIVLLSLAMVYLAPIARAAGVFDPGGKPPTSAIVTTTLAPPISDPGSDMLRKLNSIITTLDKRAIKDLKIAARKPAEIPPDSTLIAVVHVANKISNHAVAILRAPDGSHYAVDVDNDESHSTLLNPNKFATYAIQWNFRPRDDSADPIAAPFIANGWTVPSPISIDRATLSRRLRNGKGTSISGTTRDLASEQLHVRLPATYDPSKPSGLLIWISPSPVWPMPLEIFQPADKLNLIIIGAANAGNKRNVADRYQLALDGVATASARYFIDHERIYLTGMSGGGRVSSILWANFPDIFTGAIPIVGLSCYRNVPTGLDGYWPKAFERPDRNRLKLTRQHRLAAVSGPEDFNYREMQGATKIMQSDDLPVRLFSHDGMAHDMTTPDQFLEAVSWVDQPLAERRANALTKAQAIMTDLGPSPDPTNPNTRAALVQITNLAPWTDPAWTAAKLLGYTR